MTRSLTILAIGLAFLATLLAAPARAQQEQIAGIFSGTVAPVTMTFKEITEDWKRFTLGSSGSGSGLESMITMAMQAHAGEGAALFSALNAYYTRGQTVTMGEETYLIAYRLFRPGSDMLLNTMFMRVMGEVDDEESDEDSMLITEDSPLHLCLLNIKAAGHFLDITPAEPQREVAAITEMQEKQSADALQERSMNNLRQVVVALLMHAQDHDEQFPTFKTHFDLEMLNLDEEIAVHPVTKEPYHVNLALNGKSLGMIQDPARVPALYEATPWPDGSHVIAFLDGHIEHVDAEEWEYLKMKWILE
jgi:hypothetical protein